MQASQSVVRASSESAASITALTLFTIFLYLQGLLWAYQTGAYSEWGTPAVVDPVRISVRTASVRSLRRSLVVDDLFCRRC